MNTALTEYFGRILPQTPCVLAVPRSLADLLNGQIINHVLVHTDPQSFSLIKADNVVNGVWK